MALLKALWRGWVAVAHLIGKFNTALILTLLFVVLVPIFSLWRLKDPLGLKTDGQTSNWIEREPVEEDVARFERPY